MNIAINGQAKQLPDALKISEMVSQFCKDKTPVIAEVNGKVIQKHQWSEIILKEGDTVELVSFVGGG
jgi:thiamine biosynthesis protein ThiS